MSNVFEVADITDATVAFNANFITSNIYILYKSYTRSDLCNKKYLEENRVFL